MMKYISGSLLLCIFLSACNSGPGNNNSSTAHDVPKTHADSLLKDVMDGHDFAMAKMSKLSAAQKRVQYLVDSINKLPQTQQKSIAVYKTGLDSLAEKLKYADFGMNKWMEEFDYDSATKSANRELYLESENKKIANVKGAITTALGQADSLFKKE
jgi:hypothetical protein